jgi:hypothetical protein
VEECFEIAKGAASQFKSRALGSDQLGSVAQPRSLLVGDDLYGSAISVSDLVPIRHEPDCRTSTIGRWADGQYFGSLTGARGERFCAVLHEFDDCGRHLRSRIRFTEGEADAVAAAECQLAVWLGELPEVTYEDIAIAPFSVTCEGVLFGLVLEFHGDFAEGEEQDDWAELHPDRLGFHSPLDGLYDT